MKRGRKFVGQSPAPSQRTTILNFFTPASTPARAAPLDVCPACNESVPRFKMNQHLDSTCPSVKPKSEDGEIQILHVGASGSSSGPARLDFTTPERNEKTEKPFPALKPPPSRVSLPSTPFPQKPGTNDKPSLKTIKETETSGIMVPTSLSADDSGELQKEETLGSPQSRVSLLLASHKKTGNEPVEHPATPPEEERTSAGPSTPHGRTHKRRAFSTSKKNSVRHRELAAESVARGGMKRHASLQDVKKKLFEDDNEPKWYRLMPYYLENFLFCIKSTLQEPLYRHLFHVGDRQYYESFRALSLDAKKLYVRLFTRKHHWRRREKIDYKDEIAVDVEPLLSELCASSLLHDISHVNELSDLLKLLLQPELKQICRDLKLPFNSKGNACQDLMEHCRKQPCLMGRGRSMMQVIEDKAKALVKSCFKLSEEPRRVFMRAYMLGSLHQRQEDDDDNKGQQQQMFTALLVNTGRAKFPNYRIIRQHPIFKHRDHLISYEEAVQLESQVREAQEKQQFDRVLQLTDEVAAKFDSCLAQHRHDLELPSYLRRFTAGSQYAYCFNRRIEALQRQKRYQEAVDLLDVLVRQDVYLLSHRGHWYERLALNVEQHLKNPQLAMSIISNGLNDGHVTPCHKLALSQRAVRICQSAKQRKNLAPLLDHLPLLSPAEPRSVTITGRHLPRDMAGNHKSIFIRGDSEATLDDGDVTLCSVEELVLQHYKEKGYSRGLHCEGSVVTTLVGLMFWDVIYETPVADVFLSPFQSLPLDFRTRDFYEARRPAIEERLAFIRDGPIDAIVERVGRTWRDNHGQSSLVSWDRFVDVEPIECLLRCIPLSVLAALCERLLQDYRYFRSGFPDLTVWNPQDRTWRIVEVKGPNDRLSTKQILWLDFLVANGVEAEVCHVEAVGAKRMGSQAVKRLPTALAEEENESEETKAGRSGGRKSKRKRVEANV